MNNLFLDSTWFGMKSTYYLKNQLAIAGNFNMDVNKEFKQEFPVGATVYLKKPQRFIPGTGLAFTPQSINRISVPVTLREPFHVHFDWDSYEKAVLMERGEEALDREYFKPAMAALAQQIDSYAAEFAYQNTNNITGVLGTDPTTYDATSAAARQSLAELSGAQENDDRAIFLPPSIMRAVKGANIALFNPVSDISKQMRTGIVGYADSFDWYESMSLYRHTAGTWAGAVTLATTSVTGDSSLALTCTSGDTFLQGDVLAVAASNYVNVNTRRAPNTVLKRFVVTQSVTATSTAATVPISPTIYGPGSQYQNVDALPVAGAALTLFPGTTSPNGLVGVQGLAFTRNAFALVSLPLEMPTKAEFAAQERDPETGLSVRFTKTWDAVLSRMIIRFDALIGFGALYPDECAVRILGA